MNSPEIPHLPDESDPDQPRYAVSALSANGESFVDATKTWGEDHFERIVIPQPDWPNAYAIAQEADSALWRGDLQTAMNLVEISAVEAGVIDPLREDPRLFTQGPPDPFTTIREADLGFQARESLEGAAWFEAHVSDSQAVLLEPLDPAVNYAVAVHTVDPQTLELTVDKYWRDAEGELVRDALQVDTYAPNEREKALAARDELVEIYNDHGLETMMHLAELDAMTHGSLAGDREDPRVFRDGPPDRFETLAQQHVEMPDWPVEPTVSGAPVSLEFETATDEYFFEPEAEPQQEWAFVQRAAITPDEQALGTVLYMTVTPPETDALNVLEVGHFETAHRADRFVAEFNGYLMPGVLEGPELAQEAAKLEGFSGQWQTLSGDALANFQDGDTPLTRDPADWHPHNPHAERDARIEAEGLYTDPIQLDSRTDPDFDL